jgi:hypothetical protein
LKFLVFEGRDSVTNAKMIVFVGVAHQTEDLVCARVFLSFQRDRRHPGCGNGSMVVGLSSSRAAQSNINTMRGLCPTRTTCCLCGLAVRLSLHMPRPYPRLVCRFRGGAVAAQPIPAIPAEVGAREGRSCRSTCTHEQHSARHAPALILRPQSAKPEFCAVVRCKDPCDEHVDREHNEEDVLDHDRDKPQPASWDGYRGHAPSAGTNLGRRSRQGAQLSVYAGWRTDSGAGTDGPHLSAQSAYANTHCACSRWSLSICTNEWTS